MAEQVLSSHTPARPRPTRPNRVLLTPCLNSFTNGILVLRSGGASGSTTMPSARRAGVVRRYGVVRRRFGKENLRYHEYCFTDRRPGDFRLFHTVTAPVCP